MTDPDRAKREEAAHELASVFDANIKTFARVHNTLAKEKEIIDRWRHMPSAQAARHLSNDVEPEVLKPCATRLSPPTPNSATGITS